MFDNFIRWCYHAAWLEWFRNGTYSIPVLQSFHLLGLTAVLGVVCILSLRMLGIGFNAFPLRVLWKDTIWWFVGALVMTIVAGIVIGLIDPTRYLANTPFRIKMCLLLLAILYQSLIVRSVSHRSHEPAGKTRTTTMRAVVGVFALLLWFGVGWGGRLIAFFN
jgi:uncharacterized membrane protein YfcA